MDEHFDSDYWDRVTYRPRTCKNCGMPIMPQKSSSTGWTHYKNWQGIRCPNMLCGRNLAYDLLSYLSSLRRSIKSLWDFAGIVLEDGSTCSFSHCCDTVPHGWKHS